MYSDKELQAIEQQARDDKALSKTNFRSTDIILGLVEELKAARKLAVTQDKSVRLTDDQRTLQLKNLDLKMEVERLEAKLKTANEGRLELQAARIAYASEFPPDENGNPDVGSIHQNIRALKSNLQTYAKQMRALINKVNAVTGYFRHGNPVSDESMLELADRQIEVEEALRAADLDY